MKREIKLVKIVNLQLQGYTDKEIIQDLELSRRTYFYWKSRICREGLASVVQKKKPGPEPRKSVDLVTTERVLRWRDKYGWGPTKIAKHLGVHHHIDISHHQIYNLFVQTKRNNSLGYTRRIKGKTRYERMHSMTLLHTDWKDIHTHAMLSYMDDHSRFITASKKFPEATAENCIKLLEEVIRKFGKPKQVLSDRGSQFWNNRGEKPTAFTQFCIDNEIQHIKCSKASPQANGNLENFHGQYDVESWRFSSHQRYIRHWNYQRPHGGIGYLYPSEIFFRDKCN